MNSITHMNGLTRVYKKVASSAPKENVDLWTYLDAVLIALNSLRLIKDNVDLRTSLEAVLIALNSLRLFFCSCSEQLPVSFLWGVRPDCVRLVCFRPKIVCWAGGMVTRSGISSLWVATDKIFVKKSANSPIDRELILLHPVSCLMKTHVDGFWTKLFHGVGCKTDCASVVTKDIGGGLGIAKVV